MLFATYHLIFIHLEAILLTIKTMGQFIDYIASVFTGKVEGKETTTNQKSSSNNHVTFAENSFTSVFTRSGADSDKTSVTDSTRSSNKKTIYIYQFVGAVAFLAHLSLVTVPRTQTAEFDLMQPEGWQLITLSLVPLVVYLASVSAMAEINRPLTEGVKMSSKTGSLDLNNNDFSQALKIIIVLMAACQISSIFLSEQLLWIVMLIVPVWCYQLTTKIAHSEYQRFSPSPKKQLFKLNMAAKSPGKSASGTPNKAKLESSASKLAQAQATPRTRTRRAVKNIMNNVSDKYHAFEQNVHQQLSTKIFNPLSPKLKMIE